MNKTRKFDDVLDECLERLLVKNETIEQCLLSFPEHSDELKPLLETALATRKMPAIQPRPEFRDRARYQFQSALRQMGQKKSRVSFNWVWQPRWATAVATVVVLALVGSGTVAAASGSMPDSPLYGVKTVTEQVQLVLTFSALGKAELHAKLADKRVTELVYLAEADKPEKMALTTENLNTHLTKISLLVANSEMVSSVAMAPTTAPVPLTAPADEEAPTLKQAEEVPALKKAAVGEEVPAMAPTPTTPTVSAPPAQAPATQTTSAPPQAAVAERAPDIKAERAVKEAPLPAESKRESKEASRTIDQRAKLKTTVEGQAKNNIERLRTLLETAPESAKPALQRALELSEAEYKKAIEALK